MKPTLTKVFEITDPSILDTWFAECTERGFSNNVSIEAMKYYWVLEQDGKWWGSMEEGRVICVSGIHRYFLDGWRILRVAQLEARKGVERNFNTFIHMHQFYDHKAYQFEYAQSIDGENASVYVTTVSLEDRAHGPRAYQLHKNMFLAAAAGLMEHMGDREVFGEMQAVWKYNIKAIYESNVTRPGLYSLAEVTNDKNEREYVSS